MDLGGLPQRSTGTQPWTTCANHRDVPRHEIPAGSGARCCGNRLRATAQRARLRTAVPAVDVLLGGGGDVVHGDWDLDGDVERVSDWCVLVGLYGVLPGTDRTERLVLRRTAGLGAHDRTRDGDDLL
jgi:hypothetical protein